MGVVFVCLGSFVECPIDTILEWIVLKEVILFLLVLSGSYVNFIVVVGAIFLV